MKSITHTIARGLFLGYHAAGEILARWTRLAYHGPAHLPSGPALLVANHGFGTIYDMNAFVLALLLKHHGPADGTPVTILSHEAAWTIGLGRFVEPFGLVKASRQNALAALAAGHLVLVLPGGDLDAAKDFRYRNQVVFGGRHGFADIAMKANVPILPIVVSGAGDTALVISDGQRIARWLGLPRLFRLKTCPVSISAPWGLTIGFSGMVAPYIPLPAKMAAAVLIPMRAESGENAAMFAERVRDAMNNTLSELTRDRIPVLGIRWPSRR